MKKFLVFIIFLFAGAVAALPWINGKVMEHQVRKAVANANQLYENNGTDIRFDLTEYRRGYAETRAVWRVNLGNLSQLYGADEVLFTETASHGLTAILSETSLERNPWYKDWVNGPLKGKDPLTITTRYSFFDPLTTTVVLESFPHDAGSTPVTIGGAKLEVKVDQAFETVSSSGSWQGISEDDQNRMGPVSFESVHNKVTDLVWEGRARAAIDAVSVEDGSGGLKISNLAVTSEIIAAQGNQQMDIATRATADEVMVSGESLSGWSVGLAVRKVDIAAYEELYRIYADLIGRMAPALSDPDLPEARREQIMKQAFVQTRPLLIAVFEKMLKKGFGLEISPVDITLPQGQIKGHLSLGLLKDMTLAGFFPVAAQPDLALEIFSLDTEVEIPGEFLQMQPNLAMPMFNGMKTGLFVQKDDRLYHRGETRDRVLYLNGEVVDLSL